MGRLKDFKGIEGTDFFEQDRGLRVLLSELLPESEQREVFGDLHECAKLVSGPWDRLAREGNRHENLPYIVKYDRAGNRTERVEPGAYNRQIRREVAEFGILTRPKSELHKFALIY
ncbi:MAG TPA: hypothetical protein VG778_02500, partial [Blastocatellia bacterium]|nr:hypothetical protein [Blastocatellia bacterium]